MKPVCFGYYSVKSNGCSRCDKQRDCSLQRNTLSAEEQSRVRQAVASAHPHSCSCPSCVAREKEDKKVEADGTENAQGATEPTR